MPSQSQKVSVSLPEELLEYAESYRRAHKLPSRSEVLVRALKALRDDELAEAYKGLAADYRDGADPLADAVGVEGLEPSDETSW